MGRGGSGSTMMLDGPRHLLSHKRDRMPVGDFHWLTWLRVRAEPCDPSCPPWACIPAESRHFTFRHSLRPLPRRVDAVQSRT